MSESAVVLRPREEAVMRSIDESSRQLTDVGHEIERLQIEVERLFESSTFARGLRSEIANHGD